MGQSKSLPTFPSYNPEKDKAEVHLPNQFTVWYIETKSTFACYIGEFQDKNNNNALYSVSFPHVHLSASTLSMYSGPASDFPLVAQLRHLPSEGQAALIFLGGMAKSGFSSYAMNTKLVINSMRYTFVFPVGGSDPAQPGVDLEVFEWRASMGQEVKSIGGKSKGWKLARLGTEAEVEEQERKERKREASLHPSPREKNTDFGATSDGREIVAIWGTQSSKSRACEFKFMNSATSERLGSNFKVMALLSILQNFQSSIIQE